MLIRCFGARGSIPVSGREYQRFGGDTPCLEIRTQNDEIIIVDAGTGIRRLGHLLLQERRTEFTVVFTHAHWDHIIGFPFFLPLYRRGTRINFYGCPFAQKSIRTILSATMEPPFFPVKLDEVAAELVFHDSCIAPFTVDTVSIQPILLSHPNQGLGYRFAEATKNFVFLTDNELDYQHFGGLTRNDYRDFCAGADLLIHDAEYTEAEYHLKRTWGHSRYRDALQLGLDGGVKSLGLFHHNQDRSDHQVDEIVAECRRSIADAGSAMECFAVSQETVIRI